MNKHYLELRSFLEIVDDDQKRHFSEDRLYGDISAINYHVKQTQCYNKHDYFNQIIGMIFFTRYLLLVLGMQMQSYPYLLKTSCLGGNVGIQTRMLRLFYKT